MTSHPIDQHTADNLAGGECVKFVFGQAVQVLSVTVAYEYQPASMCFPFVGCIFPASGDADASYPVGTDPSGTWSNLSVTPNHSSSGWFEYTYTLTGLATDDVFRFGARRNQNDDSFKIPGMQVSLADPIPVPLPAPLALFGVGLLALGAHRRSQRTANRRRRGGADRPDCSEF